MGHATIVGAAALLSLAAFGVSRALAHAKKNYAELARSAAGGVSVAFVLLHIFVELARGPSDGLHEIVRVGPQPVHTVAVLLLVGTLATFAAAALVARRDDPRGHHVVAFAPHLGYSLLVGGALAEEAHDGPTAVALFCVSMALHLGVVDHAFIERFDAHHGIRGAVASSIALLVGAVTWTLAAPEEGAFQLTLALVAGTTLVVAFRDELPSPKDAHIGAMLVGAAVVAALEQLRWWT